MVQRYELEEMSRNPFESYRCLEDNEEGDWVKYEDYAALEKLVSGLINCELDGNHADGHRYREELMALLNISYGGD